MNAPTVRIPLRPRHHVALLVVIPLALSGLLVLGAQAPLWRGWPTATNTYALFPFVYVAPFLAALEAYESARLEESKVSAWVVPTLRVKVCTNGRSIAGSLMAATICAVLWYATARISSSITPLGQASASLRPVVGYTAMTILVIAIGHLVGKLLAPVAVVVGLAFVAALIVSLYSTQYANTEPAWVLTAGPLLYMAGAACVGMALSLAAPVITSGGFLSMILAALLATIPLATKEQVWNYVLRAEPDPVCAGDSPQICVWREHAAALAELVEVSEAVVGVAPEDMEIPERTQEYGLAGRFDGTYDLNLANELISDRTALATSYVFAIDNYTFAGYENSSVGDAARQALTELLIAYASPNSTDWEVGAVGLDVSEMQTARQIVAQGSAAVKERAATLFRVAIKDLA